MARGTTPSSSASTRQSPSSSPATSPGGTLTKRRIKTSASGGSGGGGAAGNKRSGVLGILPFASDDSPGLKVGPTAVLVISLSFIGFVVLLHIIGKFTK